MKSFSLKQYQISSGKLSPGERLRMALLTDLHGSRFGSGQRALIDAVKRAEPDLVLAAGDMINKNDRSTLEPARELLTGLAKDLPVFFSRGNHESELIWDSPARREGSETDAIRKAYRELEQEWRESGVTLLHNERCQRSIRRISLDIAGLELPRIYYTKPPAPMRGTWPLSDRLGEADLEAVQLLLAHTPRYGDAYLAWGADVTVCGHYHGGIWRFSEHIGAVSPYFQPFPRYCCGDFSGGGGHLFVSPGLGEHTLPLRIHNPRQVYLIEMVGEPYGDTGKAGGL